MRVWRAQLPNTRRGRSRVKPNIVLLLTDDQDERSLGLVPGIERAIGAAGGRTRGDVREGLRHDAGVLHLEGLPAYGRLCPQPQRAHELPAHRQHHEFRSESWEDENIASRLRATGYRTTMIGKYMNGYTGRGGARPRGDG